MRTLLVIILFYLFINSNSQDLSKNQIIGSWIVENVKILIEPTNQEQQMIVDGMKQGFTNAKFQFSENGNFKLVFPTDKPDFIDELFFLENSKWILSEEDSTIKIGTESDNYSLMWILYKIEKGETYFLLNESGIQLKMSK